MTCGPAQDADAPSDTLPTWTAKVRGDLTAMMLAGTAQPRKPIGVPATFSAWIDLVPDARRSNVREFRIDLGKGTLAWRGSARIDWPRKKDERLVGRFEGTLGVSGAEAASGRKSPSITFSGGTRRWKRRSTTSAIIRFAKG